MLKAKIEAILFLTDKPMKAQAIARSLNTDVQVVRQGLLELIHDYEERQSGLEISDDDGYIIQVKDEYSLLINEFAPLDMPVALLRTLSAIAIKQPVHQSEIIKIRGAGAYDHIKELVIRELIIKKDSDEGRSPTLSTTKQFQEYFRLSGDGKNLRGELRKRTKDVEKVPGLGVEPPLVAAYPDDFSAAPEPDAVAQDLDALASVAAEELDAMAAVAALESAELDTVAAEAAVEALELETVAAQMDAIEASTDLDAKVTELDAATADMEAVANSETEALEEPEAGSAQQLQEIFDASPDTSLVFRVDNNTLSANDGIDT